MVPEALSVVTMLAKPVPAYPYLWATSPELPELALLHISRQKYPGRSGNKGCLCQASGNEDIVAEVNPGFLVND